MLEAISKLLAVRITVAPKVFFIWANIRTAKVSGTPQYIKGQVRTPGPHRRLFSRDDCWLPRNASIPGTDLALAIGATTDSTGRPRGAQFFALGSETIKSWTRAYFENWGMAVTRHPPAGGGYRRGGALPIIGFWTPTDPGKPFVFPGDDWAYLAQLEIKFRP